MNTHRIHVALVLLAGSSAVAATPPTRREVGALVMEDVPDIPAALVERSSQYTNTRSAVLQDFDPDGNGVLISTRFGDTAQLHHVAAPGADRQQWTFLAEPVSFGAYDPAAGTRGFFFRVDSGGNENYQFHWFDRAAGRSRLLTDGKSRNESLLVARGGGRALYMSTRRTGKDFDAYVVEGHGPEKTRLVAELPGQWHPLDWSADDKRVLLRRYVSINESYLHVLDVESGKLVEVNARPGKKDRVAYGAAVFAPGGHAVLYASDEGSDFQRLTLHDLGTGKRTVITGALPWDVTGVEVSPDGRHLAYVANEGGASTLYLGTTADPARAHKVDLPRGVISAMRFDRQSARVGLSLSTSRSTSDVFTVDLGTQAVTRWTFSEVGGLDPERFVVPELVSFPSFDKRKIPAWVYRPARADGKPVPVVINIHGGPEAQSMAGFDPLAQFWTAELGVAVILPNVRGSRGYGKKYLELDNGKLRQDSVKDIGALLDWVATQKDLDASRVAVVGGSYGGFMVLASMIMHGPRLRCGVDIVGISNMVTFLEKTEEYRRDLRRAEYGDERDPAMRRFLLEIAPTTHAARITQPLYVIQGQNDPRVPAYEAEQIVAQVRGAGRQAWYLLARDEGHGFQKKRNRDLMVQSTALFLEQHLLK